MSDVNQPQNLNQSLTNWTWAVFFILLGGLWLVPNELIPAGTWALGVGILLLGLNLVRHQNGIPVCLSTIIIGLVSLSCGLGSLLGLWLPLLPIMLILFGLSLLLNGRFTTSSR